MITIYDTMTRSLREFVPIKEGQVSMYVCGPTVYHYIHIGNARSVVAFDTIRRYLTYRGYQVTYVSNFTDVDDKIIATAQKKGVSPQQLAEQFIHAFREDVSALGVDEATHHPRVMDYMEEIIAFIQVLLDKGVAYESQGDVYFQVEKAKHYGALANKSLDDLLVGASGRVKTRDTLKHHPFDFALWKKAKTDEIAWSSPWGLGRPGWHIECSVMATELLGDTIDIHAGGSDLEFPHHTNEIAQSEAKTDKPFANYWMHNAMLTIDNEKMSKSLGNFVTAHDLLKTIDGQVLRFFLASQHYRRPINFTDKALHDAKVNVAYLKNTYQQPLSQSLADKHRLQTFIRAFQEAMDADFNAANGVTVLFDFAKWINSGHYDVTVRAAFKEMLAIFGLVFEEEILDEAISELIAERELARQARDFARADAIREQLAKEGIKLLDGKDGVRWVRD